MIALVLAGKLAGDDGRVGLRVLERREAPACLIRKRAAGADDMEEVPSHRIPPEIFGGWFGSPARKD
jgi:hypothetical protein